MRLHANTARRRTQARRKSFFLIFKYNHNHIIICFYVKLLKIRVGNVMIKTSNREIIENYMNLL